MKIAMTLLLILCGLAAGLSESARLRMRSRELTVFADALHAIKSAAAYTSGDIGALLELCADNAFLQSIERLKDPIEAWKAAAERYFSHAADKALAREFIGGYGRTDLNGLLSYISLYEERVHVQLQKAEKAVEAKGKLYAVLGLFSGTAAALLLI